MKAYKVTKGYIKNDYNQIVCEDCEYFFNKEDALKVYKRGERKTYNYIVTTTYKNGNVDVGSVGEVLSEKYKEEAKTNPNIKVEAREKIENYYTMQEIDIK